MKPKKQIIKKKLGTSVNGSKHPYQREYEAVHGKQVWITTAEEERKANIIV